MRVTYRSACSGTLTASTHTPNTLCHLRPLDANELLWCLPDMHDGSHMGAAPPSFNDVYLACQRGDWRMREMCDCEALADV